MDTVDLWKRYSGELLGYLKKNSSSMHNAEDILSEVFLNAVRYQNTLAAMSPKQCRLWLYNSAKHKLVDLARKRKIRMQMIFTPEPFEDDLSKVLVTELISKLPPELLSKKLYEIFLNESMLTISLNQQNTLHKLIHNNNSNIEIREHESIKQPEPEPEKKNISETVINSAYYKL